MGKPSIVQKVSTGIFFNVLRIVASLIIGPLYSIIAVRWLQIYNFGVLSFLGSIFSMLGFLYVLGTHTIQTRFVPELAAKGDFPRLRRLVGVSQRINFSSALVTFLVLFSTANYIAILIGHPEFTFYIRLMSLFIVPGAVLGIIKNIIDALYDQKFIGLAEMAFSVIDFVLLIALVVLLELGIIGAIILPVISVSLGAILYYARLRRKHSILFEGNNLPLGKKLTNRVMKYAVPITFLNLFDHVISKPSENLFIGVFGAISDVTFYDVPYTFIQTVFNKIWAVIGGLGLISLVEIKTIKPTKLKPAIEQYVKLISLYVIPLTVGGFFLAEPLMTTLYGDQMLPGVFPFRLLIIVFGLYFPFMINRTVLFAFERTSFVLKWHVVQVLLLLALDFTLIPRFGIIGAIIAVSSTFALGMIVYSFETMVRLKVGNFMPIVAIAKYFTASLPMAIFLAGINHVYPVHDLFSLFALIVLGFSLYVLGLKLTKAFDERDKQIISRSNIPFKEIVLKLL